MGIYILKEGVKGQLGIQYKGKGIRRWSKIAVERGRNQLVKGYNITPFIEMLKVVSYTKYEKNYEWNRNNQDNFKERQLAHLLK